MVERALITGAAGMIGSHLAEDLARKGHTVTATYYRPTIDLDEMPSGIPSMEMDVRYGQHVQEVFDELRPQWIFHLAAQSYPTVSWARPQETLESNVIGTANVFEAVRAIRRRDPSYDPIVVVAGSSGEYGASFLSATGPISEDAELRPLHPYGVSKVAADLLASQYFASDGIHSVIARIFNTSGPRKRGDVISDFAHRVAALPAEGGDMLVGNLQTQRAFLHVKDTSAALTMLAERGRAGEAYNISGERPVRVAELIPLFEAASGRRIEPLEDGTLLRPTDEPIIHGNNAKILADTGWKPRHSVEELVRDVFHYEQVKLAARGSTARPRLLEPVP